MSTKEIANVAAKWWATLLREDREKFGNVRASTVYQELFGDLPELTDDALATFETYLAGAIQHLLELSQPSDRFIEVSSDYEPQGALLLAMAKANIDQDRFPSKTKLIIEDDLIRVSRGYGGKWQTILTY
jgi:hypothetical protein